MKQCITLLLILLIGLCFYAQTSDETYAVDCAAINPSGFYPKSSVAGNAIVQLRDKCTKLNAIPLVLGEKPTAKQIEDAEQTCRTTCYPDEVGIGKSGPICWEVCKDKTSKECIACVNAWSCANSQGGQISLPCDGAPIKCTTKDGKDCTTSDMTVGVVDDKVANKNLTAINTYASACLDICGYGSKVSTDDCTKCIGRYGGEVDLNKDINTWRQLEKNKK